MCASAFASALPSSIQITLIDTSGADKTDLFFGTVTSPSSYKFLLDNGISEPDLLPRTQSTFSLGTRYMDWGRENRDWTQSFHAPLPLMNGVYFHHYLTRLYSTCLSETTSQLTDFESYIMSVQAARRGVFAHPPNDKKTPLSQIEYGYHFLPGEWRNMFAQKTAISHVQIMQSDIEKINCEGDQIRAVTLANNDVISGDVFIDCLSADSQMNSLSSKNWIGERRLKAVASFAPGAPKPSVSRQLTAAKHGWQAQTPFQNGLHQLTVFDSASEAAAHRQPHDQSAEIKIGYCGAPWTGNSISIGHSAAILEPLSTAPILLLQRDIERLIELIPVSKDMKVERREYNRRFTQDYALAADFQRGFFGTPHSKDPAYWEAAKAEPMSARLENKIQQFLHRGGYAQYDLEPFDIVDWTQQHLGMGRRPETYDRLADNIAEAQLVQTLENMKNANEAMAKKLPPSHIYMNNFLNYLRKKNA
jgi:tryptophan halogenase